MDLQLMESQVPSMAAVRALQFCPYDSSLIATCGPEDVKVLHDFDFYRQLLVHWFVISSSCNGANFLLSIMYCRSGV